MSFKRTMTDFAQRTAMTLLFLCLTATVTWADVENGETDEWAYSYDTSTKTVTLLKYKGSATSVTTPTEIAGHPVTRVGDACFIENYTAVNQTLKSVVVSEGVLRLENYSFYECKALTSIELPNSLTSIGKYAFDNSGLTSITIPHGVTMIENYTFFSCHALSSVTIQGDVTEIGNHAFQGCTSLTSLTIPPSVMEIGVNTFWESGMKDLYYAGTKQRWDNMVAKNSGALVIDSNGKTATLHWLCTLTYNANGHGTPPAAQTIYSGTALTAPTAPTAQGYDFGGWYTDAACTQPFVFADGVTDNKTLYAKWEPQENTITFVYGKGLANLSETVTSGMSVDEPLVKFTGETGSEEGVEGWYTDPGCTQAYNFNTLIDRPLTLYAKWVQAGHVTLNSPYSLLSLYSLKDTKGRTFSKGLVIPGKCTLYVKKMPAGFTFVSGSYELVRRSDQSAAVYQITSIPVTSSVDLTAQDLVINIMLSVSGATSGDLEDGLWWDLSESKAGNGYDDLLIAGTGAMKDKKKKEYPWYNYRSIIRTIFFNEGVTSIGKDAFRDFVNLTTDVILPSTIKSIPANAFYKYPCAHFYMTVPEGKMLTVNGKPYTGTMTDGKADLIDYLFDYEDSKSNTKALKLAITDPPTYGITTDGKVKAYYHDTAEPIESARAGETVELSWGGEEIAKGLYVSGVTVNGSGSSIVATPNEDCTYYTFLMPANAVTVTTQTAAQEEFLLDLTTDTQVVTTETLNMLAYTLNGYSYYDGTRGNWCIDVNRDGVPDVELTQPAEDDSQVDEDDDYAFDYTMKRLPGADLVTKNYRFFFDYPFPYKYNRMLVKLTDSEEIQEQAPIEDLLDNSDNSSTIADWADEGKPHNVMLTLRTLWKDGDWNTMCLPFDVTIANSPLAGDGVIAKVMDAASSKLEGTTLTLNFIDAPATIAAGTPFLIKWDNTGVNLEDPVFEGVTITSKTPTPVAFTGGQFVGSYVPVQFTAGDMTKYYLGAQNKLYWPDANFEMNAFRAYFDLTALSGNVEAVQLTFVGNAETTAISDATRLNNKEQSINDAWYTLDGRKLSNQPTQKGIYIINGKKIVIK